MKARCICGCGQVGRHKHHAIYQQHIRQYAKHDPTGWGWGYEEKAAVSSRVAGLLRDKRNLIPVAFECHDAHHRGAERYRLHMLPDSVFEFAEELMGPGPAYEYLRRHYDGSDMRLELLLAKA